MLECTHNLRLRKIIGDGARPLYPGYSWCFRCGRPWPICKHHATRWSKRHACFPLCEDCWSELTPEERVPYYLKLIDEWETQGAKRDVELPWFLMKRQIIKSVLEENQNA